MATKSDKLDVTEEEVEQEQEGSEEAQAENIAQDLDLPEEDVEDGLIELEDGSVIYTLQKTKAPRDDENHYTNLADGIIPEAELLRLSHDFCELIIQDIESRKERDKLYEEGLLKTGLGEPAPGGAIHKGASKVTHPVLAEAIVDFAAHAAQQLIPPGRLVKTALKGEKLEKKQLDRADRKATFMSWQLNNQIEFRRVTEEMLTQLPLGGSQYKKWHFDFDTNRPVVEFLPLDRIVVPPNVNSFYSASRVTEIEDINFDELRVRIEQGLYRELDGFALDGQDDLNPPAGSDDLEVSATQSANDTIEGVNVDDYDRAGRRRLYHIYCFLRLKDDPLTKGRRAPYIMVIDRDLKDCYALYRNWESNDATFKKLDWIVESLFIPWRGSFGLGLVHLIGGLASTATGALRALLDAAHNSNAQAMAMLKGGMTGSSKTPEPGEIIEVEAPNADDVRKILMPLPFAPPNPVLYQLLEWITAQAKGVISTSEEKISDASNQMPVGTAQALLESGSRIGASIHSRLHRSQAKEYEILSRINYWYLERMENGSGVKVAVADFAENTDVEPISDPNIYSETQRQQMALQVLNLFLQAKDPSIYNEREIHKQIMRSMRVPYIEEVLPDPAGIVESNPVLENFRLSTPNQKVSAFPDQDHLAHIAVHLDYIESPGAGGSPLIGPICAPQMLEHLRSHITQYYLQSCINVVKQDADGDDIFELNRERPLTVAEQQGLQLAVSSKVMPQIDRNMQEYLPRIEALQKKVSELQKAHQESALMTDPQAMVLLKTEQSKLALAEKQMQGEMGLKTHEFELKVKQIQADFDEKLNQVIAKYDELESKYDLEMQSNSDKNAVGVAIASMNNASRERIEEMKLGAQATQDQMTLAHERDMAATQAAMTSAQTLDAHQMELQKMGMEKDMQAQESALQSLQENPTLQGAESAPAPTPAPAPAPAQAPAPVPTPAPTGVSMKEGGLVDQLVTNELAGLDPLKQILAKELSDGNQNAEGGRVQKSVSRQRKNKR